MGQGRDEGNWLVVQELLERGDPAFVDELRKITDADALGAFAAPGTPTRGRHPVGSSSPTWNAR